MCSILLVCSGASAAAGSSLAFLAAGPESDILGPAAGARDEQGRAAEVAAAAGGGEALLERLPPPVRGKNSSLGGRQVLLRTAVRRPPHCAVGPERDLMTINFDISDSLCSMISELH